MINKEKMIISSNCPNCGAEVIGSTYDPVIKCHWCHTVIPSDSYNETTIVPDQILPFKITKDIAKSSIDEYINKRKEFANNEFISSYNKDNIVPVYLPYMLVDIKAHVSFTGFGEKTIKDTSLFSSGTLAEAYNVKKEFDMTIEDVLIESSNTDSFNEKNSTSYVIKAISPFDTSNCIKYNPNFLNGYTSEYRKLDIMDLNPLLPDIVKKVAKQEVVKLSTECDRGVNWEDPKITIVGTQWTYALLPVWLYSYVEKTDNKKKIHYIAVNGRTGKIVGSIPYNEKTVSKKVNRKMRLIYAPIIIFVFAIIFLPLMPFMSLNDSSDLAFMLFGMIPGFFIFALFILIFGLLRYSGEKEKIIEDYSNETKGTDYYNDFKHEFTNITSSEDKIDQYRTNISMKRRY